MKRIESLVSYLSRAVEALFDPQAENDFRWLSWAWLGALYVGGIGLWGKFLNWGRIPFDYHDWAEVWAPRVQAVRDALLKGVFPLHLEDTGAMRGLTDRFLSIADIYISPQMLLLRFLEVGPYVLVNIILMYTLATLSLLWIRRRFNLSLISFSALFLLYHFNGNLLTHISVGHINWGGYFLFAPFLVLVFQMLDGDRSWWWVTKISLVIFAMWLQGSFHHWVWCLMLLGLIGIFQWKYFWQVIKAGLATGLLSMWRILPVTLIFDKIDNEFLGGYPSVWGLLRAMVEIVPPEVDMRTMVNPLGWWELDAYVGLVGAAFIILFGLFFWIKSTRAGESYPELLLPVIILIVLSMGRIYRLVMMTHIPLLAGERVSARMMSLPIMILTVIAALEFQKWLKKANLNPAMHLIGLGALLMLGHDIWQHLKFWQVTNALWAFPRTPRDLTLISISNHPDPVYMTILYAGGAVTLLTLAVLIFLSRRERRRAG